MKVKLEFLTPDGARQIVVEAKTLINCHWVSLVSPYIFVPLMNDETAYWEDDGILRFSKVPQRPGVFLPTHFVDVS